MNNKGIITREELITSEEYLLGNIQYELYNDIKKYLDSKEMSQTEFAEKLNVSKGYVSQVLNGDFDHKLSRLIRLYKAIGRVVVKIQTEEESAYLAADKGITDGLELMPISSWEEAHYEYDEFPAMGLTNKNTLSINQNTLWKKQESSFNFV